MSRGIIANGCVERPQTSQNFAKVRRRPVEVLRKTSMAASTNIQSSTDNEDLDYLRKRSYKRTFLNSTQTHNHSRLYDQTSDRKHLGNNKRSRALTVMQNRIADVKLLNEVQSFA